MGKTEQIQADGFQIVATGRAVASLNSQVGGEVVALRNNYNAPKGYIPTPGDDISKDYGIGSEIMTKDGKLYKCIGASEKGAVWARVNLSVVTSTQPTVKAAEDIEAVSTTAEVYGTDTVAADGTDTVAVEAEQVEKVTVKNLEIASDTFKDMPFQGTLVKQSGIKTLDELVQAIKSKEGLVARPYMNEKRSAAVTEWLTKNGML